MVFGFLYVPTIRYMVYMVQYTQVMGQLQPPCKPAVICDHVLWRRGLKPEGSRPATQGGPSTKKRQGGADRHHDDHFIGC